MFGTLWRRWQEARGRETRATAYVAALTADPPAADVRWLAEHGTGGDEDHARWELRYARRSVGLVTAQRDALNDRTASDVARALERAMAVDPVVARDKRRIAARQLNARLSAYGDALARRGPPGTGYHLGRALLEFAGRRGVADEALIGRAGEIVARYLEEANDALRDRFGAAHLPEDVAPSALVPRR